MHAPGGVLLQSECKGGSVSCQVSHDYFENAMAFFTKTIYNAIMLSVSGGDISPLVGHNAFLRWEHMKECAFQSEDGQTKYWSDLHVSEDFDIAIRFQASRQFFACSSHTFLHHQYDFQHCSTVETSHLQCAPPSCIRSSGSALDVLPPSYVR